MGEVCELRDVDDDQVWAFQGGDGHCRQTATKSEEEEE